MEENKDVIIHIKISDYKGIPTLWIDDYCWYLYDRKDIMEFIEEYVNEQLNENNLFVEDELDIIPYDDNEEQTIIN